MIRLCCCHATTAYVRPYAAIWAPSRTGIHRGRRCDTASDSGLLQVNGIVFADCSHSLSMRAGVPTKAVSTQTRMAMAMALAIVFAMLLRMATAMALAIHGFCDSAVLPLTSALESAQKSYTD